MNAYRIDYRRLDHEGNDRHFMAWNVWSESVAEILAAIPVQTPGRFLVTPLAIMPLAEAVEDIKAKNFAS